LVNLAKYLSNFYYTILCSYKGPMFKQPISNIAVNILLLLWTQYFLLGLPNVAVIVTTQNNTQNRLISDGRRRRGHESRRFDRSTRSRLNDNKYSGIFIFIEQHIR